MNSKGKILVVDDDASLTHAISRSLEKRGYEVLLAHTLAQASEKLKDEFADLLLLDIVLPDGNGREFANQMAKGLNNSRMNIVLMSGHQKGESDRQDGYESGAIEYLTKPFRIKELESLVNLIFSIRKLERNRLGLEQKLNQFFKNVSDVLFLLDSEHMITSLSPSFEKTTQFKATDWIDKNIADLIYPEHKDKWKEKTRLLFEGNLNHSFELFLKSNSGTIIPVEVHLSFFTDEINNKGGILGIARDLRNNSEINDHGYIQNEQRELSSLELIAETNTNITQDQYLVSAISTKHPNNFNKLLSKYREIIENEVDSSIYRLEKDKTNAKVEFANTLGFLKAGPKDLVKIHTTFFKTIGDDIPPKKAAKYHEEARLIILEIMGYMVSYYRNRNTPKKWKN